MLPKGLRELSAGWPVLARRGALGFGSTHPWPATGSGKPMRKSCASPSKTLVLNTKAKFHSKPGAAPCCGLAFIEGRQQPGCRCKTLNLLSTTPWAPATIPSTVLRVRSPDSFKIQVAIYWWCPLKLPLPKVPKRETKQPMFIVPFLVCGGAVVVHLDMSIPNKAPSRCDFASPLISTFILVKGCTSHVQRAS